MRHHPALRSLCFHCALCDKKSRQLLNILKELSLHLTELQNSNFDMKFSSDIIKGIASEHYNINCTIKPLAGYVDYNFLLQTEKNSNYLLKICKPDVNQKEIDFQIELLNYLNNKDVSFEIPVIIPTVKGEFSFTYQFEGADYIVRMHSWVGGKMLSDVNPRTAELYFSWGATCGELSAHLQGFDHQGAHRFDKWNPTESLYSKKYIDHFENQEKKDLANYFWAMFEDVVLPEIPFLRSSVNYSDAHEHNLLVAKEILNPQISGVIDFGDAVYAPTICELAIACAYAGMYVNNPIEAMAMLVKGYHSKFPIMEKELSILFPLICGRLMITAANAAFNLHQDPKNEYHQISAKPAWDLLEKLRAITPQFVHYYFRSSCDLEPHPSGERFRQWEGSQKDSFRSPVHITKKKIIPIDLSVGSPDLGNNSNFETISRFSRKINEILDDGNADIGIGGYGEIRPFYTTDAYKVEGNNGPEWRTMHLGTDYWLTSGSEVVSTWDGEVLTIQNNDNPCDYGPTIILKHKTEEGLEFYSLYGHLSLDSLTHCIVGQNVKAGQVIGWIGGEKVNGGWPPHLHFQLMLDLLDNKGDFPGVAFVSESKIWLSICPKLPHENSEDKYTSEIGNSIILDRREKMLGRSLSISYHKPLHMVRGNGIYLYDITARRYIDTVNNVAHVGHEHPRIVKAAQRQMGLLNTNTRYLHKNIVKYADELLSNCPDEMEVVYLVNSGSEANELALRMAKIYSSHRDIIALEAGYHGNTGACIDISSYKFDGKGGRGAPEYTTICRMPDIYRGVFKDESIAGEKYAQDVKNAIDQLKVKGRNVACFIAESILSCGGQIVLPPNYLKECYKMIREEGGLCISDEVQVGFGRVGDHFWGFELQGVVPDIITCGKPIGNGHPLAAVITTRAVAEAFTNGMEYFNTFGGNPVSCAIGYEVLAVIKDENLMQNAKDLGAYLMNGLKELQSKYTIIGDVRGIGLFLGFELVKDRNSLEPASEQTSYLANRMRELGVLMSTDGPLHNVIKIKPPMCINQSQANEILNRLDMVFQEDYLQNI